MITHSATYRKRILYDLYMKWKRNLELAAEELNINMECVWFGLKTEGLFLTESVVYLFLFAWFGYLLNGLVFLAGFSFLRVYCGGYHCSSRLSCFLSGLCICLCICVLDQYIPLHILQVLMIVSIVYLCVVCPAENDRYRLTEADRIVFRKTAQLRVVVLTGLCVISSIRVPAAYALIWTAGLCFLQGKKGGEENDSK